jgi:hypothetical protein
MTTDTLHPLAAEYLERLRRAGRGLSPGRRRELLADIEGHLSEAIDPGASDAQALTVLDRLGEPEAIIAAETPDPDTLPTEPPSDLRRERVGRGLADRDVVPADVVGVSALASGEPAPRRIDRDDRPVLIEDRDMRRQRVQRPLPERFRLAQPILDVNAGGYLLSRFRHECELHLSIAAGCAPNQRGRHVRPAGDRRRPRWDDCHGQAVGNPHVSSGIVLMLTPTRRSILG